MDQKSAGLAGVRVGETAICTVGKQGRGLTYRGYSIEDLGEHSTFEEVAYLLIYGKLPNRDELFQYKKELVEGQSLPIGITQILEQLPEKSNPMDVLRTVCSALGCLERENAIHTDQFIADRLIPFCVSSLLYWYA